MHITQTALIVNMSCVIISLFYYLKLLNEIVYNESIIIG